MMLNCLVVLVSLVSVMVSNAHLCMWAPLQRQGAFQIATPGESVCYLKEGPCGGVASGEPMATLIGGAKFNVLFQQNLNHFYIQQPGRLVADFANTANPMEDDFTELSFIHDYNAMNEITQTNFSLAINVPNVDCEHCVLRMRYVSNNPTENDRGTIFYQCADVKVSKSTTETINSQVDAAAKESSSSKSNNKPVGGGVDCCAARTFTMEAYETASWRNPTHKLYYFDAPNNLFRVDTISGTGITTRDGSFQMYSNFSSGIEYYYNVYSGTCDLFGLNYWSDWCYGATNSQKYLQSVTVGNEIADVWAADSSDGAQDIFTWTNVRQSCVPVSQTRVDTGEITMYYNYKPLKSIGTDVFTLPSACHRAHAEVMQHGSLLDLPVSPRHQRVW